ncbi:hypothetical protein KGD83_12515 [Nocardiopsis akebiae]|uniref:Uncharacterized protein n=1 Tax=Nocardiopsis akebiae TaxID=2831968 RepID=A0ABX8C9Y9_9ACTN|nr:hypothetical protein [Nocardiopsis akebiae]QUX31232.1 hypothetical protein KGD83_12515 [Nocardiopsis akebiae]
MPDHTEPRTFDAVLQEFQRTNPGWTLRCNPGAVPGRRWAADSVELLTAEEINWGFRNTILGPEIATVQKRLTREREALERWERAQREELEEWNDWED